METFINNDGTEWVKIQTGENSYACMPKSVWDEQQAKQETLGGN